LHAVRRRVAPGKIPAGRLPNSGEVVAAFRAAGFETVLSDEETIQTRYHSADDFLHTLHAQGLTGGAVSRAARPLCRKELKQLLKEYDLAFRDETGGVNATFVVQYLTAQSP